MLLIDFDFTYLKRCNFLNFTSRYGKFNQEICTKFYHNRPGFVNFISKNILVCFFGSQCIFIETKQTGISSWRYLTYRLQAYEIPLTLINSIHIPVPSAIICGRSIVVVWCRPPGELAVHTAQNLVSSMHVFRNASYCLFSV